MKNLKHILKVSCFCTFAFFMQMMSIAQDVEDDEE